METALQNLNKRKSTDWDGIPPKALKVAANETEDLLLYYTLHA